MPDASLVPLAHAEPGDDPPGSIPRRRRRPLRTIAWALAILVSGAAGGFVARELSQARLQSRFFSWLASDARFETAPGPSPSVTWPSAGPYDERLGYTKLPSMLARLTAAGAEIEAQARWSPRLRQLARYGLFPAYREKTTAGLKVLDRSGSTIYEAAWPGHTYKDFESIPPVVVHSLLFIENRELLDPGSPLKNPAVEWPRLGYAVGQMLMKAAGVQRNVPGASTLATQLEKYRHADEGLTRSAHDKLRQMMSASVRAYLDGPDTSRSRRRIVLDYVNTLPLGAAPVHGEVRGVGEGFYAWFGADREAADKLLRGAPSVRPDDPELEEKGRAYRRLVALLIGQRRPHHFFLENREALRTAVESYLRVMPADIISPALRDAALRARFEFADEETRKPEAEVTDRKGADVVRVHLLDRLGVADFYTLDRLDLTVSSSLDADAQVAVSDALRALNDPKTAAQAGLVAPLMLDRGDPAKVRYSFTLFERVNGANVLRVQTDTVDGPFSLNEGMKLELGSTAKLRTLVTYLEVVAELHARFKDRSPDDLAKVKVDPRDPLTAFVVQRLREHPGEPLLETLEAAMDRPYSGSPKEAFVTGGGVHRFHNFTGKEDVQVYSVRDAFAHSVNLSFIRIMRDLVDHFEVTGKAGDVDLDEPAVRQSYLERFADFEGRVYLRRFYRRYEGLAPGAALEKLVEAVRPTAEKLTVVFRSVRPEAGLDEVTAFVKAHATGDVTDKKLAELYERHAPGNFDLQDRGYLAGVHPLELWLVGWLQQHPQGTRAEAEQASAAERLEVYRWLMGTSRKVQQDRRIRVLVEMDAFTEIHKRWQRVGYPFDHLVPSLGTALGSSGDRPTALAELVGILLADGVRYPTRRVDRLHFAENTPYDTTVKLPGGDGERVLPPEVCQVVREAMRGVVTDGTASRVEGAFDRWGLQVGGKTGTGDNRRERFDRHGHLIGEEVRNRTGTLAFYIGDRWFGAVTAHVPGQDAANYHFTSALSAQVLKYLAPSLKSVFEKAPLARPQAPAPASSPI